MEYVILGIRHNGVLYHCVCRNDGKGVVQLFPEKGDSRFALFNANTEHVLAYLDEKGIPHPTQAQIEALLS